MWTCTLPSPSGTLRVVAVVLWASFELQKGRPEPQYRAGLEFKNHDPGLIERLSKNGTKITVRIVRPGRDKPFDVSLTRETIVQKAVKWEVKDGIGILNIRTIFGEASLRPRKNVKLIVHLEKPAGSDTHYVERLPLKPGDPTAALLEKITSRFMEGRDPTEFSLIDKFGFLTQGILTGKIFEIAKSGNEIVVTAMHVADDSDRTLDASGKAGHVVSRSTTWLRCQTNPKR